MTFGDGLRPKEGCKVCAFIATQDDRERVEAFFADTSYSATALADEMTASGSPVDEASVRRHRRNHMGMRVRELR